MAIWYDNQKLMILCERMICDHTDEIFTSNSFPYCGQQVLNKIVSMQCLSCIEMNILIGCMRWAETQCFLDSKLDATVKDFLDKLGDIFRLIRFKWMSFEEFTASIKRYPDMFEKTELQEILIDIDSQNSSTARERFYRNQDGLIVCSRLATNQSKLYLIEKVQRLRFSVNHSIKLYGILLAKQTIVPDFSRTKRIPELCSGNPLIFRHLKIIKFSSSSIQMKYIFQPLN